MKELFEKYTFNARLMPVFITTLPVCAFVIALFPEELTLLGTIAGISVSLGLPLLLSHLGRDAGKKRESLLFKLWGGMPSNLILSYQHTSLDTNTLERYRNKISALMQMQLPTREEETKLFDDCLNKYQACSNFLREKTRDATVFALLFSENINYGFRRNLWGLKPLGITLSTACGIASGFLLYLDLVDSGDYLTSLLSTVSSVLLLTIWIFIINPEWVKVPAMAYAERLVSSCETLT